MQIWELKSGDYIYGTNNRVYKVVEVGPTRGHEIELTIEAPDGVQTVVGADMWQQVPAASVLDFIARA